MPKVILPTLALLFFVAVFLFQAHTPAAFIASAPDVRPPESIAGFKAAPMRFCQDEQCGAQICGTNDTCDVCGGKMDGVAPAEKRVLPADTVIRKRHYTGLMSGASYAVSFVIGGTSKSSIHRPELCLPSQGFMMLSPETRQVGDRPWHVVRFVAPRGGTRGLLAYTFFNQEGFVTCSHTARIFRDTWDRSVLNRVDRWVMITVNASQDGAELVNLLNRISQEVKP